MSDLLALMVLGIATGAVYGLAGSGLVLTYKTSGIFNFGHGAIATTAAYTFYFLHVDHRIGWILALLVSVLVVGPVIGLVFERIAAQLALQRTAFHIVGTVGIVLLVQGLASIKFGADSLFPPQYLPKARDSFKVEGAVITYDKVIIAGVALVAVTSLYVMFRSTRMGVAMRAVVDDPNLVAMHGVNPDGVRRLAWVIGSTFAALSGVLIIPLIGLNPILLTLLVVDAFGAATIGAFSSIPLTFLGGVLIGVGADISKHYVIDVPWLAGLPASLPFIVLFVALFVIPRYKLVSPSRIAPRTRLQYRAPGRVRLGTAVIVLVPLLLLPQFVGAKLVFFTVAVITAIMLLSLGLLVRTSGQISLCHAALAAVGAVAFSQFRVDHGMPWILALVLAGLVATVVGALVAIPAIRLSGLFLALATLGFGILIERLLYGQTWMFTTLSSGRLMPLPSFAHSSKAFYYVALGALGLSAIVAVSIQHSRLGRVLQGMSGSATAMIAMGLSTNVTKVIIFCTSAFFAGIAGALLGVARGFAVGNDPFFISFNSLILLAMLAVAPFAEPWYALVGTVGVVLPAYITGGNTTFWLNAAFGLGAVVVAIRGGLPSMPPAIRRIVDQAGGRRRKESPSPMGEADHLRGEVKVGGTGVAVSSLSVRFGGLVALDGVSFAAPMGQITGLIGPNGAGKTTTFDVCSGLNRRFEGRVELHGRNATGLTPSARGRRGLGRTFQRVELCDTLSVLQNVMLGREAGAAGANVLSHLLVRPAERRAIESAAWSALRECGIADLAELQAGALSTGQRRLVELARLLAGRFDVLLLDEPSSGLDHEETARFAELLERVVDERGVGVLLVEHDMALVMRVCAHIYVLDFGRRIFEGTPEAVAASPVVRGAYLGDEALADTRIGNVTVVST